MNNIMKICKKEKLGDITLPTLAHGQQDTHSRHLVINVNIKQVT